MTILHIANIKCSGCENTITKNLKAVGIEEIRIDRANQTIEFKWESEIARKTLEHLGYPEIWSEAEKSLLTSARSYVSCAIGKVS